jgi:hypothetical protein
VMVGIFIFLVIIHETFSRPWMLILKLYTNIDLSHTFNLRILFVCFSSILVMGR